MTITRHPSDATLAAFASGTLDDAHGLVVASHVALCQECRNAMRALEQVGGAFLHAAEPAEMRSSAFQRALAQLDNAELAAARVAASPRLETRGLPAPLSRYDLGPWRWIGRGVQWRAVETDSDEGVRALMLKAAPGTRLPRHRHTGTEWTCVFEGAFHHDLGRYGAGDFDEADETVEHRPVVEEGVPCVCLVALRGNIRLQGWLGRLVQPFIRI